MMVSVLVSAATMESADRPPGNVAVGQEIIAQGALALAEAQAEQRDAHEIQRDDREIESVQSHRLLPTVSGFIALRWPVCATRYLGHNPMRRQKGELQMQRTGVSALHECALVIELRS